MYLYPSFILNNPFPQCVPRLPHSLLRLSYTGVLLTFASLLLTSSLNPSLPHIPIRSRHRIHTGSLVPHQHFPTTLFVKIGFDVDQRIVGVRSDIYSDAGWTFQGGDAFVALFFGQVQ